MGIPIAVESMIPFIGYEGTIHIPNKDLVDKNLWAQAHYTVVYKYDETSGTYGMVIEKDECPPTQRAPVQTSHICGQCDMATARWSAHSSGAPKQYLCSMCFDIIAEWAQKMYSKLK